MAQKDKTDAMVLSPATPAEPMSYEAFLEWADEDRYVEWVNGKVVYMSPPSHRHQDVVRFLTALFSFFVETSDLGVVLSAPFQMKTGLNLPGREPDVLFVAKEHLDRLKQTHLDGPADLVVEIISPESFARDRGDKFREYEEGGVCEYWLIDPTRKQAEFYQLGDDGVYRVVLPENGVYQSAMLAGLRLDVAWLWQEPLPPLLAVLKSWELI